MPYWFGFVALADFKAYTSLNLAAFVPLTFVAFIPAAFAFGELRRVTGSVWPTVVMHTVGNAIILTLLLNRLIEFRSGWGLLRSPPAWKVCSSWCFGR